MKYKAGWNKDAKGVWHYGNKNGTAHTGWLLLGRTWYYLDPANGGAMKTGWYQDTSKRWFYSNGSGAMLANRWLKTANTWYHVGANGARQTGWLLIGRTWYWLDPANAGAMKTGWYQDTSKRWFYSNGSGAMLANRWLKTANTWYHVGANGARQTGWLLIGRTWYWLYPEKAGAMAANTMCTIGNARYSFDSSGAMRANCQIRLENNGCGYASSSGAITRIGVFSGGKVILKDAKGRILTGWQRLAGAWFYGQAKTGIMHTGWLDVGGARYYLNSAGAMVTGTYTINGKSYTFASSGALAQVTGNAALDSRIVSFAKSQGSLWNCYVWVKNHKHTNWASSGGVTRYANGTHALTTPWVASEASRMLDGKTTDCYAFSSAFACLAKGLGYDAKVVNGYVPSRSAGWSAHSWVEIRQGNTTYVYDPDLGHSIPSVNFYGFTYSNAPTNYKK